MTSQPLRSATARRARRGGAVLLALGASALSGCYAHVPSSPEALVPPQRVRAHLTPAASARVSEVLGGHPRVVDGVLLRASADEVALLVPTAYVQSGLGAEALRQELRFEPRELVALERRELDRVRTGALAGLGATVVGVLLYRTFSGESGGTTTPPPGGGPPEARIPALRGW